MQQLHPGDGDVIRDLQSSLVNFNWVRITHWSWALWQPAKVLDINKPARPVQRSMAWAAHACHNRASQVLMNKNDAKHETRLHVMQEVRAIFQCLAPRHSCCTEDGCCLCLVRPCKTEQLCFPCWASR